MVNNPISIQGIKIGSLINNYSPLAWSLEGSSDNKYYEPIISISEGLCDKHNKSIYRTCDGQNNKIYNTPKTKEYEYFKISQIGMNDAIYSTRDDKDGFIYSLRLSIVEFYLTKPITITLKGYHTFCSSYYIFIFVLLI